jgi:hypothetical protein
MRISPWTPLFYRFHRPAEVKDFQSLTQIPPESCCLLNMVNGLRKIDIPRKLRSPGKLCGFNRPRAATADQ